MTNQLFPFLLAPFSTGGGAATPQGGFITVAIDGNDISASVAPDLQATLISNELSATVGGELVATVDASPLSASLGGSITAEINDGEL